MASKSGSKSKTPTAALEVESKFSATPEVVAPSFDFVPQVGSTTTEVRNLSAIYLDTADLRLTRSKHTLRRRTGGPDEGWHLKAPGNGGRLEYGVDLEEGSVNGEGRDADYVVPTELLAPVRAIVRNHPLQPIAQVDNERHVTTVFALDGTPMAEFADDHVTATSFLDGGETTTWREWEIELLGDWADHPDGKAVMAAMSKVAEVAGAVPSESPSKLATALGDSIDSAPLPPTPAKLPKGTPGRTVVDALAANVAKMVEYDPKVRRDEFDSVHQMRVATRELRSHMQTFHGIVVGDKVAELESNLKQLAGVLGVARDAEVVAMRWEELLANRESAALGEELRANLVEDVQKDYDRAHQRVIFALNSSEYLQLLDDLDEFLANPPIAANSEEAEAGEKKSKKKDDSLVDDAEAAASEDASAADSEVAAETDTAAAADAAASTTSDKAEPEKVKAPKELDTTAVLLDHLRSAFSKFRRRHNLVLDGREDADLPEADLDERYHDVRKAAKKLRYSAEAAQNADLSTEKLYAACKNLQSVLGDFQDTCTARDFVLARAKRASRAGRDAFGYGVLYQMEYYDGLKALAEYDDAVAKVFKAFRKMEKKIKKGKKA
ncbi:MULTISPECIES: CYTH and CHAD domain-containing protein [Corynebacterium]|uniref:CYTH and CHAD domain-containing protein n=1 Tax=Corynebacterium amycolatum TaxID=43765 RepID=A0AB38XVF8_CORAY|nr:MULTISPECIES: CYTH and CHAD domain-containing protein [Corynebacterium]AIN82583.1 CYTH domain protein [Corynebacterium sp. ATCC 6931]KAA9289961.1 CYTH and CHAD domain-containing protein [Corynebacterium amycolatum]MBC6725242.1 CHAD domain-containing protein [Corynebacterium amycolatum]MDY7342016.1 CYTH and CHAD domain-containing protein [Corynebacterium amycolatum]OFN09746.1 chad domain containing protein [Corynebacterium sp. HMSC074C11]